MKDSLCCHSLRSQWKPQSSFGGRTLVQAGLEKTGSGRPKTRLLPVSPARQQMCLQSILLYPKVALLFQADRLVIASRINNDHRRLRREHTRVNSTSRARERFVTLTKKYGSLLLTKTRDEPAEKQPLAKSAASKQHSQTYIACKNLCEFCPVLTIVHY